jgi:hypothetical protein
VTDELEQRESETSFDVSGNMKQGQGSKRTRGRSGGRRGSNRQQLFDSNGPSVRIRGNAFQVHEKYLALARDAAGAGDRVAAENYYQHAEHYFRIYSADQEERAQRQSGNGQVQDGHRRHGANGADRSPHQPQNNGNGRPDRRNANGANGAEGGDGENASVAPDSEIDLTVPGTESAPEAAVTAETGDSQPAPARRPRRRKPVSSE